MGDIIDAVKIREFLSELSYPLYFLDFETIYTAEPLLTGSDHISRFRSCTRCTG